MALMSDILHKSADLFGGDRDLHRRGSAGTAVGADDPFFLEQFKALRAKLEYLIDSRKCKVVGITSAIAGEGKTLLSTHLAINLAATGRKKVLLIDVDLRKSDLANGLAIAPRPGLSEFLLASATPPDIVRNSLAPGLFIIPGGERIADPADLLAGDRFREFLRQVRDKFDVVLLDTPPVLPVADTLNIKEQVDGFIMVFRAGFTPHPELRQAVEELGEKSVLGVVINGVAPRRQKYYQRYYGKYYRKPNGTKSSS